MALTEPSVELLTSAHRNEAWRFDLLDLRGNIVGTADGVTGGSLDFSRYNTIRSGGTLGYDGEPRDWNKYLIRVWYVIKCPQGVEYGWPFGTFHVGTDTANHEDTGQTTTLELYDNLLMLDQDGLDNFYQVPKGMSAMEAVETAALGGLAYSPGFVMDETDETIRACRVWEPTEENTRLRVVNDLLESINYGALDTNGYGAFEARYLGSASSRGIRWEFRDDESSIYNVEFAHERDTAAIPNKVVGYSEGDEEEDDLLAVATDEDPDSPWSFQSRGRWITRSLGETEATSQAVLQDQVDTLLRNSQQVSSAFDITHDVVPLRLNDAVLFENGPGGIDVRAVVQSYTVEIDFEGGSEMRTRVREVIS